MCFLQALSSNDSSKPSSSDSGPYWSSLVAPSRRFTEGPPDDKTATTETKADPPGDHLVPVENQSPSEQVEIKQRAGENKGENEGEMGGTGEATEGEEVSASVYETRKAESDESKLMPPPPAPLSRAAGIASMPPPSFIPPRPGLPSKCTGMPALHNEY